jgi:long-chain acyl-CoA synthetase
MNVGKVLTEVATAKADETAIIFKEKQFTYGNVNAISNSLAKYLMNNSIRYRDNVAVILRNCPEYAFLYYASVKIGALFTPIDVKMGEKEISSILDDTKAKVCFVHPDYHLKEKLSQSFKVIDITSEEFELNVNNPSKIEDILPPIKEDDTALYLHTSGTTGKPKIVELTYSNLDCFPDIMKDFIVFREREVLGMVLPMSHVSGPIILNLLLAEKCRLVIIDSIHPNDLFENISRHRITFFHAVPPVFSLMVQSGLAEHYDTSSLDVIVMMGTSVPVSLMNTFKRVFSHVIVLQGYGMTETSPVVTVTKREDADKKRSSIGALVRGVEVKVVDEEDNPLGIGEIGELIVKGQLVMKGYLNLPEENNKRIKNGFFHTGDLVKYDSDNYYYHMGRRDEMVVLANGQNVYPSEIKNVIFTHSAVLDSEVIGVYSEKEKGNILHAFVVPSQNESLSEKEIRSLCSERLGTIKTPKKVTVLTSLPKTSMGKTNIQELKSLILTNDA